MHDNQELQKRIEVLYRNHYTWLLQCSKNITKNTNDAEDLIGDLMIYLIEKGTPKIYYKDSLNLLYCFRFLKTRWVNKIHKSNRIKIHPLIYAFDIEDEVYPVEDDERIMEVFDLLQEELTKMSKSKDWAKVKLFQMYYGSDDTMLEIANKIGICKSTTFMNIKKIREHLKQTIPNPFVDAD